MILLEVTQWAANLPDVRMIKLSARVRVLLNAYDDRR